MVWPWYGMEWFRWWMISMVWWWILPAVGRRWMVCWTSIADRSYLLLAQVRRASERLKVDLWHRSLFFLTYFFRYSNMSMYLCSCVYLMCICKAMYIYLWKTNVSKIPNLLICRPFLVGSSRLVLQKSTKKPFCYLHVFYQIFWRDWLIHVSWLDPTN